MPDDDRSESGHPAVPSTVRSDDVPSSDPGSGALPPQLPRTRRAALAATRLRSLVLLLLLPLLRHLRPLGPALLRDLAALAGALTVRAGLPARYGPRRPARVAVAAGVVCCLGALAVVQAVSPADPAEPATASGEDQVALSRPDDGTGAQPGADRSADRSSRSGNHDRSDAAKPAGPDPDTASPLDDAEPVAGLSEVQMDNARAIVRTGRDMGISRRGLIIGVATAMQESTLLNRASEVLPESKRYRHQGTGWDHDSVGLFQQRTSSGWGPVNRLMDPAYASARFFEALRQVPGWERMRLTEAAQAVQYSGYPEHYAKHEGQATRVVDALVPSWR
ncbi:hypothetical protein O7626_21150 [Micromonospora sp. WMMD1102]|uniref:hypothetical protein n=1 Tax=Micromonospora sp. WMMD1102 TaxID=3016105 RepID=UPI002415692B|nr:hypothetical protein [Micromonospora sp. WMMD1102]MDG4788410.1 hypothetical protein [Micromonospora sp. WMMD1102]